MPNSDEVMQILVVIMFIIANILMSAVFIMLLFIPFLDSYMGKGLKVTKLNIVIVGLISLLPLSLIVGLDYMIIYDYFNKD